MIIPGILFSILSIVIFALAYFLYYKEAYWLVSGLNFSPRETVHERYDIPGLTKHLGRMCGVIGLVMLISAIGAFLGRDLLFAVPVFSLFAIVPVFMFGTERYMYVGRKAQRIINIIITAVMVIVLVFVSITTIMGAKPPVISVIGDELVVESMYGAEIPLDSIRQVGMTDLTGKEISKRYGFNMGNRLKGRFDVEGLGSVTIYQQGKPCNSVLILTDEKAYVINLGDETKNADLRTQIMEAMEIN